MKLIILAIAILFGGCTVKICECNDGSPKTIKKTIDNNSSETQILTVPRTF